ncbi:MAG: hypothetical protein KDC71_17170, partial [Acidobacteria bacterium]|nr:hypothetical protein [Acidobacteriota bacterium]
MVPWVLSRAFSASCDNVPGLPGLRAIDSCLIDYAPPFAHLSQAVGLKKRLTLNTQRSISNLMIERWKLDIERLKGS